MTSRLCLMSFTFELDQSDFHSSLARLLQLRASYWCDTGRSAPLCLTRVLPKSIVGSEVKEKGLHCFLLFLSCENVIYGFDKTAASTLLKSSISLTAAIVYNYQLPLPALLRLSRLNLPPLAKKNAVRWRMAMWMSKILDLKSERFS